MSRQSPIPRPKGIPELEPEDVPADNRRSGRLFKVQLFWRDPTTKRYWCRYPQCPYSNKDSPTLAISHYKHVHMGKRKIRYKKLCKLCDYLTSEKVLCKTHAMIHAETTERRFPCKNNCGRAWFSTHHTGWQHEQKFCPKRASRPPNLYARNWNDEKKEFEHVPNENLDKGLTEVDFSSYGAPERPGSQPSVVHTPAPRHPLPSNHHAVDSDSISTPTQATSLRPLVSQDQPATGYHDEGWTVPTHPGYNNLESSGLAGSASHLQSNFCTSPLQSNLDTSFNDRVFLPPGQATPSFDQQQYLHQTPYQDVLSHRYHRDEFDFVDPSHPIWSSSSPTPQSFPFLPGNISEYTPISRAGQSSPAAVFSNSSGQNSTQARHPPPF